MGICSGQRDLCWHVLKKKLNDKMVQFPFSKIKTYLLWIIQIHNSVEYYEETPSLIVDHQYSKINFLKFFFCCTVEHYC